MAHGPSETLESSQWHTWRGAIGHCSNCWKARRLYKPPPLHRRHSPLLLARLSLSLHPLFTSTSTKTLSPTKTVFACDSLFVFDSHFTPASPFTQKILMASRKLSAVITGPDPGTISEEATQYLGRSLVKHKELNALIASGAIIKGLAFLSDESVIPEPGTVRTIVFAAYFDVGLRFPCDVLLPRILRLFGLELLHLSPSALVRVAIFD